MSAVAEPGMSESTRAGSRGIRFFALAGVIVAFHLAALAVLLSTEYGPFAITLSLLAWVFVNCLLLPVLPRPGDLPRRWRLSSCVLLIALSHFKFGILQSIPDVPRFPDHRPRYVFVPALGVSAVADRS